MSERYARLRLDRMELENWLCNRLRHAQERWKIARQTCNAPSADGHLARSQAAQAYKKYADALSTFTELVVKGNLPPESVMAEWRASRETTNKGTKATNQPV